MKIKAKLYQLQRKSAKLAGEYCGPISARPLPAPELWGLTACFQGTGAWEAGPDSASRRPAEKEASRRYIRHDVINSNLVLCKRRVVELNK
jgi:hypothetical protein